MNKEIDVIGLGVSTMDVLNIVDHFPDREEVQKSPVSTIEGGGPVATAIVTLARLGVNTIMLDKIGDDWIGSLIIKDYKKYGVNTDYIKINPGCTSSLATLLVRKSDGARTIVYSPGNVPELNEGDISEDLISKAKFLHINGRHYSACIKACNIAKEYGTQISFDGGSYRFNEEMKTVVPLTDICIVSKDFAEKYSGEKDLADAADILLRSGPEIVIITDGINGSSLFTNEIKGYHQKAFIMQETVDTTGCGDSFHGAFLFGLCNNYNLYDTILLATATAALNSRHLGGRSALPDKSELFDFLKWRD